MLLGIHTYSLHLHGFGPTDICGTTAPSRAMDIFELIDDAAKIGVDGLHITPTDCGAERHHYSMFSVGRSMFDVHLSKQPCTV